VSKHAISQPRWRRRIRVIGATVVVGAFLTALAAGATGRLGSRDDADRAGAAEPLAHAGPVSEGGQDDSASAGASIEPAPTVTGVPPQRVHRATELKRSLEWLRRGLVDETSFRVGTLNVLGDSHTAKGGNKKGWASGYTRMGWAYSQIMQADLDVVGFQEFETPQYHRFQSLGGSAWDVYPGPALDRGSIRDSIAWRTDTWTFVEGTSISIPYFHGQPIRRPVVKLQNVESGRQVWFFNTHNPASTPRWGNNARWRSAAISKETELANELGSDGTPVVFTGDYNDRAPAFCPLTSRTDLVAANGGSSGSACRLPSSPGIDWIFGSGMEFSKFVSARHDITGRVTDHPFVYAEADIPEEPLPPARAALVGHRAK
jgi:Endonuclease/Exonuclease/phosphatase family